MADAAHELRTPAAVIQTTSELVLSKPLRTREEYEAALQTLSHYSLRLIRSIDDVFRLAQADAGFRAIRMDSLYLDEVLTEAVRAARTLAASKSITVQMPTLSESPYRGEESLLGEMFLNLLENAIKYTPQGGSVFVEFDALPHEYRVTVKDTGVGISAEDRSRIFDRFFRAQPAAFQGTFVKPPGSGLGLAIALWVAESHQGTLQLQTSSSEGSVFVVALPRIAYFEADTGGGK
jgi:signal transduction histidine kinase